MPTIDDIQTIVVVMMENRSFDHILGYLSLPPFNRNLEGLKNDPAWLASVANSFGGASYPPFHLTDALGVIGADPPHERPAVSLQLGGLSNGMYARDGFVANYAAATGGAIPAGTTPPVMGYFGADEVPMTHFLAQNFAVCDHWFSSLPAGTQPNRLMAMSGFSMSDMNHFPMTDQELVYDWLTRRNVRWRVYHDGLPFFAMMPSWIDDVVLSQHFRPLGDLVNDIQTEPPEQRPQVIFVEPMYTDAPHLGPARDDHMPTPVKNGQEFLLEVYRTITQVPDVWSGLVMVVTYDEHGGFFDHVSPPLVKTPPPPNANYVNPAPFDSLGVRVPAIVISPFVTAGHVFQDRLDHTSILKLIGHKFDSQGLYSSGVDGRDVGSVWDVLNTSEPRDAPAPPPLAAYLAGAATPNTGLVPGVAATTPIQHGFTDALNRIRHHPGPGNKFGDLLTRYPSS